MLRSAKTVSFSQFVEIGPDPRGHCDRRLNADDLIAFGRCPARWHRTPDGDDPLTDRGPSLTEWLAFGSDLAPTFFVKRPDTYEALVLRCPKCNSRGPARVCRKCGLARRHVVELRPWSTAATACADWAARHEEQNRRVIPTNQWDLCALAVQQMRDDPAIAGLNEDSARFVTTHGVWRDDATGLEFPLESRVTLTPDEGTPMDNALVGYAEVRNADPVAWEYWLSSSGAALSAALALLLHNGATKGCRNQFLWIVVERDAPRLVCRRRAAQELLAAGRTSLSALLGAYAQCLARQRWPSFEDHDKNDISAWTETHVQTWCTTSADGGFFAPHGAERLIAAESTRAPA